jgi:hypothetical protein
MQTDVVIVMDTSKALANFGRAERELNALIQAACSRHAFVADKYGIRVYQGSATIETRGPGQYFAEVGYGNF